jgi:hypothetical protein
MKVYEILNEWGRIVKGVNTTPDVDTSEIKTQAAKFGNTVDKDGKPPTLSKKVKGSKTNVLFNLGMTENSIFEALEEAWSEKYKRSINCNNPKGFSQKAHCAGRKKNEAAPATAPLPELRPKNFDQIVARYKNKKPSALVELLKKFAPDILILIAAAIGLAHLSFLQKFFIKQGINFSKKQMQKAMAQAESIEENFADGKVKGKSRPGRVKRAGASCNGSVTDLRKRAKNASGEKAKMLHWCANMKSGRQK